MCVSKLKTKTKTKTKIKAKAKEQSKSKPSSSVSELDEYLSAYTNAFGGKDISSILYESESVGVS